MKINSVDLANLTKQFIRVGELVNKKRDIVPFILDEIGGKFPLVKVTVVDKPQLNVTNNKVNPIVEDIIDDINKVLLKRND